MNAKTYLAKKVKNDATVTDTDESSKKGVDYSDEDEPQLLIDLNPKGRVIIIRLISRVSSCIYALHILSLTQEHYAKLHVYYVYERKSSFT